MVEREREHGDAHLGAEPAALVAHPDPGAGVDLAHDPEVPAGHHLLADHPSLEPDEEVDRPVLGGEPPARVPEELEHAPTQVSRLGVGPRDDERHLLWRVHAVIGLVDELQQPGVVVGPQLQPRRAQHEVAKWPRLRVRHDPTPCPSVPIALDRIASRPCMRSPCGSRAVRT
jgi:hypothetical protein